MKCCYNSVLFSLRRTRYYSELVLVIDDRYPTVDGDDVVWAIGVAGLVVFIALSLCCLSRCRLSMFTRKRKKRLKSTASVRKAESKSEKPAVKGSFNYTHYNIERMRSFIGVQPRGCYECERLPRRRRRWCERSPPRTNSR